MTKFLDAQTQNMIRRQKLDQFLSEQSDAWHLGKEHATGIPAHRIRSRVSGKICDHRYNPFVTRSIEWEDYRAGVVWAVYGVTDIALADINKGA